MDSGDEVLHINFFGILNAKVVNHQDEVKVICVTMEEAMGMRALSVCMFCNVGLEFFVVKDLCLGGRIRSFPDLHRDTDEEDSIILVNSFS